MTSVPQAAQHLPLLFSGDIPSSLAKALQRETLIACDVETSGLDWRSHRLLLLQLYSAAFGAILIRVNGLAPNAIMLLEDASICKVFHHAVFDLRFLTSNWNAHAKNVVCTKIAAKLLFPNDPPAQRLQALARRFLGIMLDKTSQTSDWSAAEFAADQIEYAVNDVQHLPALHHAMTEALETAGLRRLAERCYAHIPTRVELELREFGDVYTY